VTVAVVAIILAYRSDSPVRPEFGNFVLATAAFSGGGRKKVSVERKLLASRGRMSAFGGKADIEIRRCHVRF